MTAAFSSSLSTAPADTSQQVVADDGTVLHMAVHGQGPPLLLLHGFPDNGDLWLPLLPALSPRHRVGRPDLRGYRHSGKPASRESYTIDRLVADVLALADALAGSAGGKVHLAGHDWGGMLAWAFAALHPERVERLVIFNAPHPCRLAQLLQTDPAQQAASAYLQRLAAPDAAEALAADDFARLRGVVQHALPQLPAAELQALMAAWAMPDALRSMLHWYGALDAGNAHAVPSLGGHDGHIPAPTLLLWGDREGAFVPANLHGLERWVPRLQIHQVADAGHWLPREQPAFAAQAMLNFLARP